MILLDLFSGIGGFPKAAEWVWGDKLEIIGMVENDKYCQKVLRKNYPKTEISGDIRNYHYMGSAVVDLLTGGFPCQDVSVANANAEGLHGEKSNLWVEMWRVISECRPRFVIIENVPMLTVRGLNVVLSDLAKIGYDAEWQCVSAASVGAWHKRERIWIIAYPSSMGWKQGTNKRGKISEKIRRSDTDIRDTTQGEGNVANPVSDKHRGEKSGGNREEKEVSKEHRSKHNPAREFGRTSETRESDKGHLPDTTAQRCLERNEEDNRPVEDEKANRFKSVHSKVPNTECERLQVRKGEETPTIQRVEQHHREGRKEQNTLGYTESERLQAIRTSGIEKPHTHGRERLSMCPGERGSPAYWDVEPDVGELADGLSPDMASRLRGRNDPRDYKIPRVSTNIPERSNKLKALGNAIVPQVAYIIMLKIKEAMDTINED